MADQPAQPKTGNKKSNFGFLTNKVLGIPIWVIALGAVGIWYWYTHYGPGAQKAAAAKAKAPRQQRPQVIVVPGGGGHQRKRPPPPPRGQQPPVQQPVQATAPMTAGDIYGTTPTATMNGATYDSGQPTAAQMGGSYVPPANP